MMITILIFATVKSDHLEEYKKTIPLLTKEAKERAGCITYKFNQRIDSPSGFVLYEQWESQSSLDAHIAGLSERFGSPRKGEVLPAKLIDMYEKANPVIYEYIE